MMKKLCIYVVSIFVLTISNVFAEKSPEELASTCLGCHGVASYNNIYPAYKVPKLGNQHKEYIISALKAYKSGERPHPTMRAHASNLNDKDIEKIADYFSTIKFPKKDNLTNNTKIIEEANACVACHGVDGNSVVPAFPKIGGQYKDYIFYSLKSYKDGKRKNAIMAGIVGALNEEQMENLSKYFSLQEGLQNIIQGPAAD